MTNAVDFDAIVQQPLDVQVDEGDAAKFLVLAPTGKSYQWQRNGRDIPGANSARYTLRMAWSEDDGAVYSQLYSTGLCLPLDGSFCFCHADSVNSMCCRKSAPVTCATWNCS